MVRANLDMFSSVKILTQANQNAVLKVNFVSNTKKFVKDLK